MYNQPEVALAKYDLAAGQITKGRGAYICETNQGTKLLVPYNGSEERAVFLKKIMAFIQEEGMPVEQILETTEGTVLSKDDSETNYILKDYIVGEECNTKSVEETGRALSRLAQLHNIMEKYDDIIPEYMKGDKGCLLELCEKHNRELINTKNYIRTRKKKNEFEMLFQQQYAHFSEHAQRAIDYFRKLEQSKIPQILCHGDFNQHNVVLTEQGWKIINFERMNYNWSVLDLANFLRKIMEKNDWDVEMGKTLLARYEQVGRLKEIERKQLGYLLLFPEKFWKITNHYGNAKKSWVSGRDIEKLEKLMEQEENRIAFLEKIFSF